MLSGRCVARLSAKKLRVKKKTTTKKKKNNSKRAKLDGGDNDDGDDGEDDDFDLSLERRDNDAVCRALADVSALFYDEETGELVTGSADGHVHVWSNNHG